MWSLAKVSLQRYVGVFLIILGILIGGTWATVKFTTDHLLYKDATSTAKNWARLLAESVGDLEQIAGGEQPSTASMAFFQWAQRAGQVFRYEIYNRAGYSQLIADRSVAQVNVSEFSADAVRSLTTNRPVVDVRRGSLASRPPFYAQAYVPVVVDGQAIAIVAAYVDQTEKRNNFYNTSLIALASLSLLTTLSFGIPAIAWYRGTKEKQQADRRIRFLAHHDALTGLANRPQLIEQLSRMLAVLPVRGGSFAVHFIDLDHFKEVNDTLGHDGGDCLLKTVAERLRAASRTEDVVARLGGDEFVVVQADVINEEQVQAFSERLVGSLAAPIKFKEQEINAAFSAGIAIAPIDGDNPERLLKCADLALYKAKSAGRNCVRFFVPEMDSDLQARITLEKTIRNALANDGFVLHYQPVYEMAKHHLIGFEALVRLPAGDGTLIPPLTFIPIAENLKLIDRLGAWVLGEACRAAATWPEHLTVAVNLSPAQFDAGSVSAVVANALKEAGLAPNRLELEITENLLLGHNASVMAELRKLKEMGVAIVMDDFGTGYSSLSYLWRFPFNKIKIDRSFMQGLDGSGRDAETVIKTIIALGRELNMRVTVEGVETAQQVAFLDGADADQVQGYFFGRPVPGSEVAGNMLEDFRNSLPRPPQAAKLRVIGAGKG
jgi:diguanylate cyclase (GGDEF)-like protein